MTKRRVAASCSMSSKYRLSTGLELRIGALRLDPLMDGLPYGIGHRQLFELGDHPRLSVESSSKQMASVFIGAVLSVGVLPSAHVPWNMTSSVRWGRRSPDESPRKNPRPPTSERLLSGPEQEHSSRVIAFHCVKFAAVGHVPCQGVRVDTDVGLQALGHRTLDDFVQTQIPQQGLGVVGE